MGRAPVQMERVRASRAAAILGVELRTVQALAARGELPGAAKIGGSWTFDEAALRNYIRERTTWPRDRRPLNTRTGEAMSSGRDLPLQARNSAKASQQALRELLRGSSPK